jgi:hypothetical protein
MLQAKNNFDLSVTLYEFVGLWDDETEVNLSNISNKRESEYHHGSLAIFYLPTPPEVLAEEEKKMTIYNIVRNADGQKIIEKPPVDNERVKSFVEELIESLLHDEKYDGFPKRQNIEPTYKHDYIAHLAVSFSTKEEFTRDFYSYKLCELIDWVYKYSIPEDEIPDWVKEYQKPPKLPAGLVEIETLPKLIQLAINAHQNIDWNIQNTKSSKIITSNLKSELNKEAIKLELENFMDDNSCLSGKLLDQLVRVINPKNN